MEPPATTVPRSYRQDPEDHHQAVDVITQKVMEWHVQSVGASAAISNYRVPTTAISSNRLRPGTRVGFSDEPEVEWSDDEEINQGFPDYIAEATEVDYVADESGLLPAHAAKMPGAFPESVGGRSPKHSRNLKTTPRSSPQFQSPPLYPTLPTSRKIATKNSNWGTSTPVDMEPHYTAGLSSPEKTVRAPSSASAPKAATPSFSSARVRSPPDISEEKKPKRAAVRSEQRKMPGQQMCVSPGQLTKPQSPRRQVFQQPNSVDTEPSVHYKSRDLRRKCDENRRPPSLVQDDNIGKSFSTMASKSASFGFQQSFTTTQPTSFDSTTDSKLTAIDAEDEIFVPQPYAEPSPPPPMLSRNQGLGGALGRTNRSIFGIKEPPVAPRQTASSREGSPPSAQLLREFRDHSSRASTLYSVGASTEREMMELDMPTTTVPSSRLRYQRRQPALNPFPLQSHPQPEAGEQMVSRPAKKYKLYNTFDGEPFPGDEHPIFDATSAPFWLRYEATRLILGTSAKKPENSQQVTSALQNLIEELGDSKQVSYEQVANEFRQAFRQFGCNKSRPIQMVPTREAFEAVKCSNNGRQLEWSDRLQLTAELVLKRENVQGLPLKSIRRPTIRLQPLQLQSYSYRFGRRFGSHRFLILRLPDHTDDLGVSLDEYTKIIDEMVIGQGFRMLGREWRTIYFRDPKSKRSRKGQKVQTGEKRKTLILFAESGVGIDTVDRREAIEWLIPVSSNLDMTECKFWARMSLAFTPTAQTLVFEPGQIEYIDDIKAGENSLTDGCGLVSHAVLREVSRHMGLEYLPTAIQARIGPAKGLFIADAFAPPDSDDIWIKIRSDQTKFKGISNDVAHRTLDVVQVSSSLSPTTLNFQLLPILLQNGVPYEALADLLREDIAREIGDLFEEGRLSNAIYLRAYLGRISFNFSRDEQDRISARGSMPAKKSERAALMLESGFTLQEPCLRDWFYETLKAHCDDVKEKMHIRVAKSCYPFCIPDPSGRLKKGQIYLRFSQPRNFVDPKTMLSIDVLQGDVLVGRNPAHFASDIQRVTAVDIPELRHYVDVVVFSTDRDSCDQSLASHLSGGDYDGDKVWTCWDPRIVDSFINGENGPDSVDVSGDFITNRTTMRQRLRLRNKSSHDLFTEWLKDQVKSSLQDNLLGLCTDFFERVVYKTYGPPDGGVNHRSARELAAFCGKLVDAPKQGDEIHAETWKIWSKKCMSYPQPLYKIGSDRDGKLSKFPVDKLKFRVATAEIEKLKGKYNQDVPTAVHKDPDIVRFFEDTRSRFEDIEKSEKGNKASERYLGARAVRKRLNEMVGQIDHLLDEWHARLLPKDDNNKTKTAEAWESEENSVDKFFDQYINILPNLDDPDAPATDLIREWAHHGKVERSQWSLLRAAATYNKSYKTPFPWTMAFRELCYIKCSAVSTSGRFITEPIYLAMKVKAPTMAKNEDDMWMDTEEDDYSMEYGSDLGQ
ncbi:hypothetical protein DRE_00467 [Drechslerella stenobrocha 248]|uniref:RNA-dependent RNA polymerase n=1 Tax=Drechslerella stenobrocha 248 TaxID=1043628 RepID=W7HVG3_9PEZI|nr:hypothetical protein DRE_00467 [Drechslerella stenobrocha 248]